MPKSVEKTGKEENKTTTKAKKEKVEEKKAPATKKQSSSTKTTKSTTTAKKTATSSTKTAKAPAKETKESVKKDTPVTKSKTKPSEKKQESTPIKEKNVKEEPKEKESNKEEDENNDLGIGYVVFLIIIGIFVVALVISVISASIGKNTPVDNQNVIHKADKEMEVVIESDEEIAKKNFNGNLEFYVGDEDGYATKSLLDEVKKRIEEESEHSLVVKYNDEEASDLDGVKEIKDSIKNKNKYKVEVEHNEEGYVNKIIISDEE